MRFPDSVLADPFKRYFSSQVLLEFPPEAVGFPSLAKDIVEHPPY
jgi:hypothetical protein